MIRPQDTAVGSPSPKMDKVVSDKIAVTIPHAEPTVHPLPIRLRVDGVETALVPDISARPPRYDPAQTVSIT